MSSSDLTKLEQYIEKKLDQMKITDDDVHLEKNEEVLPPSSEDTAKRVDENKGPSLEKIGTTGVQPQCLPTEEEGKDESSANKEERATAEEAASTSRSVKNGSTVLPKEGYLPFDDPPPDENHPHIRDPDAHSQAAGVMQTSHSQQYPRRQRYNGCDAAPGLPKDGHLPVAEPSSDDRQRHIQDDNAHSQAVGDVQSSLSELFPPRSQHNGRDLPPLLERFITETYGNGEQPSVGVQRQFITDCGTDIDRTDQRFMADSCRRQNSGELESDFEGRRRSARVKKPSEKGFLYNCEIVHKRFKSAVSDHKRKITMFSKFLIENPNDIAGLYEIRKQLENSFYNVADCYHKVFSLDPSLGHEIQKILVQCQESTHDMGNEITQALRLIEYERMSRSKSASESSKRSEKSKASSKASKSCKSSKVSSASKSASCIKADAMAKAAAIRAKLKFVENEAEQKAKLEKLRMTRDLEVEEAKLTAISEFEGLPAARTSDSDAGLFQAKGMNVKQVTERDEFSGVETFASQSANFSLEVNPPSPVVSCSYVDNSFQVPEHVASKQRPQFGPRIVENSNSDVSHFPSFAANRNNLAHFATEDRSVHTCAPNTNRDQTNSLADRVVQPIGQSHGTHSEYKFNCDAPVFKFVPKPCEPVSQNSSHLNDFTSSHAPHGMEDLVRNLGEFICMSRLPVPEPGLFNGDVLQYFAWRNAFTTLIENYNIPESQRIYYLQRYLEGDAKGCVASHLLVPSALSFQKAMDLLDKRFGDPFSVACAFKNKIESWAKIAANDYEGLRKFSDFLCQVEVVSRQNPSLNVLNDDTQNRMMINKLPNWLVTRWAREVHKIRQSTKYYPTFAQFVSFLSYEADIACDPVTALPGRKDGATAKNNTDFTDKQKVKQTGGKTLNTVKVHCKFCNRDGHTLDKCFKFQSEKMEVKQTFIKQNGICFGCLTQGHTSKTCKKRLKCSKCEKLHPTILHSEVNPLRTSTASGVSRTEQTSKICDKQTKPEHKDSSNQVSLFTSDKNVSKSTMVVPVYVRHCDNPNKEILTYALLDTQSDTSFITEDVTQKLGVDGSDTTLRLSTMTADDMQIQCKRIRGLSVRGYNCDTVIHLPPVFTKDKIPASDDNIPTPEMADFWPHLRPMVGKLMPKSNCGVGLLIGYNCSRALAPREVIPPVALGPFAFRSDLGWGIVGLISGGDMDEMSGLSHHICSEESGSMIVLRTKAKEVISPKEVMEFFEREEGFGEQKGLSQEDIKFMTLMQENIKKTDSGKYQLPLPIRNMSDLPPDNKVMAAQRLKSLGKQFAKKPEYYKHYKTFMNELFDKNYAELVPLAELGDTTTAHYLPHHGVYNVNKPNKVRVVMDASARFMGKSLNDCLLKGPDLLNSLLGVLCRFRKERIAITCDIEAMFQQFLVTPDHRNFLRFLWYQDGDYTKEQIVCRSTVHLFGAASSPAVANFGLKRTAIDHQDDFEPNVIKFIQEDFYVDDGLTSVSSPTEAKQLIHGSIDLCSKSGLRLQKFVCNSREVLESLDNSYKAKSFKEIDLRTDDLPIERALGVSWCVESDQFKFRVTVKPQALTRRGVLSTVCSIYDPLGFISPVVLLGKSLLQEMCKDKLDWDDPLPTSLRSRWEKWLCDLPYLNELAIERCYKPADFTNIAKTELHSFADASQNGYAQCTYLRTVEADGRVHCSLVMAKARVTPLRAISIPRLELTAALLATETSQLLDIELQMDNLTKFYWTDSQIVLGFVSNEAKRFQTYVANRVQRIRDISQPEQWKYVPTNVNPADIASRGAMAKELSTSWFTGPSFLQKDNPFQVSRESALPLKSLGPEVKKAACLASDSSVDCVSVVQDLIEKHSRWNFIKRVLATCLKFSENLKAKVRSPVQVEDVMSAERLIIRVVQNAEFKEEIHQLHTSNQVKLNSRLTKLDPFIDDKGLLRVGGRIKDSSLEWEEKHPLVLPKRHLVSSLVVKHCHETSAHQGRGITMNSVRNKGFWILGLSSVVSSLIFNCVFCRRHRGQVRGQKMSDLPKDRFEDGPPFTHVAVDCFGPFFISERRKELKRHGMLFTCMVSRAVHIESVQSMDSDSFINALRRFISLRGPIRSLRCDQGSNFMGGIRQLKLKENLIIDDKAKQFMLDNNCDFIVNAPHASHQGGVWERQIRSARSVLGTLLASEGRQLDDEGLRTVMYEVASVVNSRPLTSTGDVTSPLPLSPNMLLTMKSNVVLPPPGDYCDADKYSRKRWRRVQYIANAFWERWRKEFICQLQQRQKWHRTKRNFKIGDIILVIDETLPRSQWKLGKVTEVVTGSDQNVRRVKFVQGDPSHGSTKVALKTFERPVHKLVLILETDK